MIENSSSYFKGPIFNTNQVLTLNSPTSFPMHIFLKEMHNMLLYCKSPNVTYTKPMNISLFLSNSEIDSIQVSNSEAIAVI